MKNLSEILSNAKRNYLNLGLAAMLSLAPACQTRHLSKEYNSKNYVAQAMEYTALVYGSDKAELEKQLNAIDLQSLTKEEKMQIDEYNSTPNKKGFFEQDEDIVAAYGFKHPLTSQQIILMRRQMREVIINSGVKHSPLE